MVVIYEISNYFRKVAVIYGISKDNIFVICNFSITVLFSKEIVSAVAHKKEKFFGKLLKKQEKKREYHAIN